MKTLIITGGSKGIGKATAALFCEQGYNVINIARTHSGLDQVRDLSLDLSAADLDDQIDTQLIPLLTPSTPIILIHNAAQLNSGRLQDTSGDELHRILNLNVTAVTLRLRIRCNSSPLVSCRRPELSWAAL